MSDKETHVTRLSFAQKQKDQWTRRDKKFQ